MASSETISDIDWSISAGLNTCTIQRIVHPTADNGRTTDRTPSCWGSAQRCLEAWAACFGVCRPCFETGPWPSSAWRCFWKKF